jgi:hypothetical protein
MRSGRNMLDYSALPPSASSDLPGYKRYSPGQLVGRLLIGMLIVVAAFSVAGIPLIRFFLSGGK